jgi:hypothetical protein
MEQQWVLENDMGSQLNVDIAVSTNLPANKIISSLAARGILSSKRRAYKLGPDDLGNLAIMTNTANPDNIHTVFWVNHNVIVKLHCTGKITKLLHTAYAIDEYLTQDIIKNPYDKVPKFQEIEISADKITVDQPFWIKFHPESESDMEYLIGPKLQGTQDGAIDKQGQDTLAIQIKISKPGEFEIPMWIGDKRTLLSSRVVARVTVKPEDEVSNR